MIRLSPYTTEMTNDWDNIVTNADNSHFMLKRDYVDYHSNRFIDASYMIYKNDELIGVVPGNKVEDCWHSHQGLTFGGILVLPKHNRTNQICQIYQSLIEDLKQRKIRSCTVKLMPHIYHSRPCEADLYALYCHNVESHFVEVSTAIDFSADTRPSQLRTRKKKRALKNNLSVKESSEFKDYWRILSNGLKEKYETRPTHTLQEIELLHSHFPNSIKLFEAHHHEEGICGGIVIYETLQVAHAQYISATSSGQEHGALDLIFLTLIEYYREKGLRFFDFGISTENKGEYLNENLIQFKESFGGRPITHSTIVSKL